MIQLEKLYHSKLYSEPALVQSYHPYFSGGIGDFLGGAVYLRRLCEEKNLPFYIDFKHHPLSCYLVNAHESAYQYSQVEIIPIDELCETNYPQMEQIITEIIKTCTEPTFTASFYFKGIHEKLKDPVLLNKEKESIRLAKEEQKFFQKALQFSAEVEAKYEGFLQAQKLVEKNYDLVHFRLGDRELLKDPKQEPGLLDCLDEFEIDYHEYLERAQRLYKSLGSQLVVLSDSNSFKEWLKAKDPQLIVSPSTSAHSVFRPGLLRLNPYLMNNIEEKCSFDLAFDMRLIKGARSVTSFSNHFWGSGLPFWLSKVFDIPISSIQMGKLIRKGETGRKEKSI